MPIRDKVWLCPLFIYSGIVRLAILILPFRTLAPLLGQHHRNVQLSPLATPIQLEQAWRIGRIVRTATRWTPWQSKCLVQAILVRSLFTYYEIPYVLYLGTTLTEEGEAPMKSHAWIKVGPWIVIGREGHRKYHVVGSFISPLLAIDKQNTPPAAIQR